MWKNINYRIKKLEKENALLKRIIREHTDWLFLPDVDVNEENSSESEEDYGVVSQESPNGQDDEKILSSGRQKKPKCNYKKYILPNNLPNRTSIITENKKMIATSVVSKEFGEGTIYSVSEIGRFNVHFNNGEEHDFPYNAFSLGLLKRKEK